VLGGTEIMNNVTYVHMTQRLQITNKEWDLGTTEYCSCTT
jgi:hypothetical protein